MKQVSLEKARAKLGDIVDRARLTGHATVITRYGEPAAFVAPIVHPSDRRIIVEARQLAKSLGYDSDPGAAIGDLLDIIGRLTADTVEDRPEWA